MQDSTAATMILAGGKIGWEYAELKKRNSDQTKLISLLSE
jgi:hypothetical protein